MADCRLSRPALAETLRAAGAAHHEYEEVSLKGVRDDAWAGWYAAYGLGRLGNFASASDVTAWLSAVEAGDDWPDAAAGRVSARLVREAAGGAR